eukprot:CAMPEP_0168737984 /NCGR_PEP_ID=MMETSP0724-20121128/10690_1 /TAXON_ID=265536 /ORGANISM="Amphiprora sp., Strain CCMP467" /LENGTH=1061 /DNA_ID=CAMNT_0008785295 /DNA_START=92 /DNA_END=3277 /DNA_ORIENTATION=-
MSSGTPNYYNQLVYWANNTDIDVGNTTEFDSNLVPVQDVSVEAVITSVYFNCIVFVMLMIAYELMRRTLPHVYSSRQKLSAFVRPHMEKQKGYHGLNSEAGRKDSNRVLPRASSSSSQEEDEFGKVQYSMSQGTDMDDLSTTSPLPPLADILFKQDKNLSDRPRLKGHVLDWLQPVLGVPWTLIRKVAGLDGYFFLRYIRMNVRITAVSAFWFFLLLVPTYVTGNNGAIGWYHLSAANVKANDSWRMWMPVLFMYLFSAFVIFVVKQEYKHYLELRQDFLARGSAHVLPQNRYSLMVESIPLELRSDRALFDYFEKLFPGKIHSACVVLKVSDLDGLSKRCMRTCRRLEKSIAYLQATGRRPSHNVGQGRMSIMGIDLEPMGCHWNCFCKPEPLMVDVDSADSIEESSRKPPRGTLVDSISYYTMELAHYSRKLKEYQKSVKQLAECGSKVSASTWIDKVMAGAEDISNQIMKDSMLENSLVLPSDSYFENVAGNAEYMTSQYGTIGLSAEKRVRLLHDTASRRDVTEDQSIENDVVPPFSQSVYASTLRRWAGRLGMDFAISGLRLANRQLDIAAEGLIGSTMSSTGFVTFLDLSSTTCAVSAPLTVKPGALKARVAPEPREINWENVHISKTTLLRREQFVNLILFVGVILWSFPLAAIQAFAKAEYLAQLPGMRWILTFHGGTLTSFVNGYLPVVALLVLIIILPLIFEQIARRYERRKTFSDVQSSMLSRYFFFQLANVYVSVTAGSILKSLADILDHPSNILGLLGDSLPTMVGYFVALLVTKIMAGLPMVFLRFGALSRMLILRLLASSEKRVTQRELDWVYRLENVQYGWEFPTQLLVVVIVFTYAIICPIILPFGLLYFLGALTVYKKQILYVYSPVYESGGAMFPIAIQRTLFGLVCGQMTLLGYTVTRHCYYQPASLIPLPIMTVWAMRYMSRTFAEPSGSLSMERARHYDRSLHVSDNGRNQDPLGRGADRTMQNIETRRRTFDKNSYRQPVLTEVAALPWMYRRGSDDDETVLVRQKLRGVNRRSGVLSRREMSQEIPEETPLHNGNLV